MGEKSNTPDPGTGTTTGGPTGGTGATTGGGGGGGGTIAQDEKQKALDQLPPGFSSGGEVNSDGHLVAESPGGGTAVYQNGSWVNTGTGEIYNTNPGGNS